MAILPHKNIDLSDLFGGKDGCYLEIRLFTTDDVVVCQKIIAEISNATQEINEHLKGKKLASLTPKDKSKLKELQAKELKEIAKFCAFIKERFINGQGRDEHGTLCPIVADDIDNLYIHLMDRVIKAMMSGGETENLDKA